ncbi:hypothetical protein EV121DRAFT_295346 [Schizophyllum commune]
MRSSRHQQSTASGSQAPILESHPGVQLQRLPSDVDDGQARLMINAAIGQWVNGRRPPFMRFCLDTGDESLWAYHPDHRRKRDPEYPDNRPPPTTQHQMDTQAPRPIDNFPTERHTYEGGAYLLYFNNIAPITIETGNTRPNGAPDDIFIPRLLYQVATEVSYSVAWEDDVDGYIGFNMQPSYFDPNVPFARITLMNQLRNSRLIDRDASTKIFVISPSYARDIHPKLYLGGGGAGWPTPTPSPFGKQYTLNTAKEIAIPCYPSPVSVNRQFDGCTGFNTFGRVITTRPPPGLTYVSARAT